MANTITLTTVGKQAFENFAGQTNGADATSVDFTLKAPAGQKWIIKTVGGVNYITPSDGSFTDINSGISKTYDAGAICLAQFSWAMGSTSLTNLMRFAGAAGGTIFHCLQTPARLIWSGGYSNTGIMSFDSSFASTWTAGALYTTQSLYTTGKYRFTVFKAGVRIFTISALTSTTTFPTGSAEKWFGSQMGGAGVNYIGNAVLQAGGTITFAGLTAGMKVNLLNASTDAVENTLYASGATTSIDLSAIEMFPLNKKIVVLGTDGSTLLTTSAQTIFGGDTWTYSGDTAGASGGGAINVINNNM